MQLIAVRMADRVQPRLAVEVDGVDHQRVAFPMTHRVAKPGRNTFAMLPAVDRYDVEPRVLLEEEGEVLVALHDLHRLRCIYGASHAEREAGARVIAVGGVVLLPLGFAPGSERKHGGAFLTGAVLGHVWHVRLRPDSAEVHFA